MVELDEVIRVVEKTILELTPIYEGEDEDDGLYPLVLTHYHKDDAGRLLKEVQIFKHCSFKEFREIYSENVAEYYGIDRDKLIEDVRGLYVNYYKNTELLEEDRPVIDVMDVAYGVLRQILKCDECKIVKLGRTLAVMFRNDVVVEGFKNDLIVILPSDPDSNIIATDVVILHAGKYGLASLILNNKVVSGRMPYEGGMSKLKDVTDSLDYAMELLRLNLISNTDKTIYKLKWVINEFKIANEKSKEALEELLKELESLN